MLLALTLLAFFPGRKVALETHDFYPVFAVVPFHDQLMIPHFGLRGNFFHSYDMNGKWQGVFGQSGQGPSDFGLGMIPNFNEKEQTWLVADLVRNSLKVLDYDGRFRGTINFPDGVYPEDGTLLPSDQGFIVLVDAFQDRDVLVKTDRHFKVVKSTGSVFDPRVVFLFDAFYKTQMLVCSNGDLVLLESLVPGWRVYDQDLNLKREVKVRVPKWRSFDLEKVKGLSEHDWLMERWHQLGSEIVAARLVGERLLLGTRHPGSEAYDYLAFSLTGEKVAGSFTSSHLLVGAVGDQAIFTNPDAEDMALYLVGLEALLKPAADKP